MPTTGRLIRSALLLAVVATIAVLPAGRQVAQAQENIRALLNMTATADDTDPDTTKASAMDLFRVYHRGSVVHYESGAPAVWMSNGFILPYVYVSPAFIMLNLLLLHNAHV